MRRLLLALALLVGVSLGVLPYSQASAATCHGGNQFVGSSPPPKHSANVCTK